MCPNELGYARFSSNNLIYWNIPSFQMLEQKQGTRIWSPLFCYSETFHSTEILRFSTNNERQIPKGFFALLVYSNDSRDTPVKDVEFGVCTDRNVEISRSYGEWCEEYEQFRVLRLVSSDVFKTREDYFRIFCEVISNKKHDLVKESTNHGEMCGVTNVGTQTTENEGRENDYSKQCSNRSHRNFEKLIQNFKDLYIQGQDTDLVLLVKGREFKVHKAILRSRSPVFNAMFLHGLSESTSGIVPIEDCEPSVFEEFLLFIYAGNTENISSDNVCQLYYVADKYQLPELKEECVCFLKKYLSIETICDVIYLSTKHNEKELLDQAINFFASNMEEILITVKWQQFLSENPTEANELTIKALKIFKGSCSKK